MPAAHPSPKPSITLSPLSPTNTDDCASPIGESDMGMPSPSRLDGKPESGSRKPRAKTCPACREKFEPVRHLQVACSLECAIRYTADLKAKRDRKETRDRKAKLKSRRDWLREAQAAFNRFIRLRDAGKPCISCGRHHQGQWHAGHYLSVGARPELRFEELNVHAQCAPCNNHLSGNIVLYRQGLITKIGSDRVEWLEGPHEPKHYSIDDLKAIKRHYTALAKELT